MANVNIRQHESSDIDRCYAIWEKFQDQAIGANHGDSHQTKADFIRVFSDPQAIISLAENDEGVLLGWQALVPMFANPHIRQRCMQVSTYLERRNHVQDLGTTLLKHNIIVGRDHGVEHIYAWVKSDNKAAQILSKKFHVSFHQLPASKQGHVPEFYLYIIDTDISFPEGIELA